MHKATTWFSLGKNSNLLSVWFCPLKTQVSVNFGKKNTKKVSDFPLSSRRKQSRLFFAHSTEAVPQTNRVPHVGVWIYPPPHLLSEYTKQVWVHDSGTGAYISRRTTAPQSYITMHIATIWTIVLPYSSYSQGNHDGRLTCPSSHSLDKSTKGLGHPIVYNNCLRCNLQCWLACPSPHLLAKSKRSLVHPKNCLHCTLHSPTHVCSKMTWTIISVNSYTCDTHMTTATHVILTWPWFWRGFQRKGSSGPTVSAAHWNWWPAAQSSLYSPDLWPLHCPHSLEREHNAAYKYTAFQRLEPPICMTNVWVWCCVIPIY